MVQKAEINAALATLQYQGNLDFNGSDLLTVLTTQNGGNPDITETVAIVVTPVADAPVNTAPGAVSVDEDTPLAFTGGNLISVADVENDVVSTQLTVASGTLTVMLDGAATISDGANDSATLTISGTQAEVNATLASLSYQGNQDFNGGDTLTVLSTDATTGTPLTDTNTVTINVNPIDDDPINTVPGAQTVAEDTALSFTGANLISVTDADDNLASTQLTVVEGTLNVTLSGSATISVGGNDSASLTISGSEADINATLASLSYQGDLNFNGADTLTVLSHGQHRRTADRQ